MNSIFNKLLISINKINVGLVLGLFLISLIIPAASPPQRAEALSGSQFNPGRIIDDTIFYNSTSMTATQIQNFLNSKVPACDTNGAGSISYHYNSSTGVVGDSRDPWVTSTRAIYGDRYQAYWDSLPADQRNPVPPGSRAPYTCINTYQQSVQSITNSGSDLCKGSISSGTKSSAQIIYDVAKACGINPQVLIVLLQKEQSLITDTWPWGRQYSIATGYGCPDTAPCDSEYYGFFNQVYQAAKAFKRYAANPDNYNYRAGRNNTIYYHPDLSRCGSSTVFIENQATANLYIYTPYQPNKAALDNLYGTGDSCSAYGNRNFWRMFNDWFGTTKFISTSGCTQATNTTIACVWNVKNFITDEQVLVASYDELNNILTNGGHTYLGINFFGNVSRAPQPGNIPVYNLSKPNGATFVTTNAAEKDAVIANYGYTDKGIGFYADPSGSNSGFPIHRLYSASLNKHIWTGAPEEKTQLIADGYTYEGVAFTSISSVKQEVAPPTGKSLVYRFSSMPGNSHFWTTSISERDRMILAKYRYEGVAWLSSSTTTSNTVHRLYSPSMRKHLYTTDINEKNVLAASGKWNYEGMSHYVSSTQTAKPVYRLYSPITTNHLWTASSYERDVLVKQGTFRYEGIGWYQP